MFSYKGRPFVALVSTHLPTPNSTYIDHLLCAELGLRLSDIQCKKMSFAGQKLRLLGKISCTVQCVLDGNIFGSYQLKANVIENLYQHFDSHCIAGKKMNSFLNGDQENESLIASSCDGTPLRNRKSSVSPSSTKSTPESIPSNVSTFCASSMNFYQDL